MKDSEAMKEYEQKFCHVSNINPTRIIFVTHVELTISQDSAFVYWINLENPTNMKCWFADLKNLKQTLQILC